MAHRLEQFEDGDTAFFTNREVAWHALGTVTDGALTADQALETAFLDWTVTKSEKPVSTIVPAYDGDKTETITYGDKFMTYRYHPKSRKAEALGVVGSRYTPVQNSEAFGFLNSIADESGAVFETAGSIDNGRKVFMTMKMPEGIQIGGVDAIDMYLMAWNTHDGSSSFNVLVTPIRVVCQNTLTAAINSAKQQFIVRHTSGVTDKIEAARDTLKVTFKYQAEFKKIAENLLKQSMADKDFYALVEKVFPIKDEKSPRAVTMAETARATVNGLWKAPTQANIANTKWAAYNAFAEYADWAKPVRDANPDTARAIRIVTGAGDRFKNKVLNLL
jgi:phage/plasmid-like protein (TIGR03299 family)